MAQNMRHSYNELVQRDYFSMIRNSTSLPYSHMRPSYIPIQVTNSPITIYREDIHQNNLVRTLLESFNHTIEERPSHITNYTRKCLKTRRPLDLHKDCIICQCQYTKDQMEMCLPC